MRQQPFPKPDAAAAEAPVAPVPAPVTHKLALWVRYVLALVSSYAKHNTDVAAAFIADPAVFSALTESGRCRVFNTAMTRHGVGIKMPQVGSGRQRRNVWDAATFERGMIEAKAREPQDFYWVHVRYSPLPEPEPIGGNQRVAMSEAYANDRKAGLLGTDAPDFVNATRCLTDYSANPKDPDWTPQAHAALRKSLKVSESLLVGRPAEGGYVVAVKATLPEREARPKSSKTAIGGLAILEAEGVTLD